MVKLNKIYTRTGDEGTSGLVGGARVGKESLRMHAIGEVDEAGSAIGLARLYTQDESLKRIQHDLFDLGADIATPEGIEGALRMQPSQVARLENEIDAMNEALPALESFVLAGGTPAAASLFYARAVVRRAERAMVALSKVEAVNADALRYINRLSDHLFVLARYLNREAGDVLWQPGVNR